MTEKLQNASILLFSFICFFFFPPLLFGQSAEGIVINEFMASNGAVIADNYGEYEDWIELYNPTGSTLSLEGFYLSDDESQKTQWQIPEDTEIAPGDYLLIWASGRNQRDPSKPLHTNFRISRAGEPLLLTAPDGETVLDDVPPLQMARNVSYGRSPDGGEDWQFFGGNPDLPYHGTTPGFTNTEGADYQKPPDPPDFSREGGWYANAFSLTLSAPPGKKIYYTLDGSDPHPEKNPDSTYLYNSSIQVHDRTAEPNELSLITDVSPFWRPPADQTRKLFIIRARSFCPERESYSTTNTHTYGIGQQYSLPVVSLTLDREHLFNHEYGIYVMGSYWEEAEEVGVDESDSQHPANYHNRGRKWECPPAEMTEGLNYRCAWLGIVHTSDNEVLAEAFARGETPETAVEEQVVLPTGQEVKIRSTGGKLIELNPEKDNDSYIKIDGTYYLQRGRGMGLIILDSEGSIKHKKIYDTYRCFFEAQELADKLDSVPAGHYILLRSHDEITRNLTHNAFLSLQNLGFQKVREEIKDITDSVSLEYIEDDGKRALAQNIGIRIHGGVTRSYPNKSIRLYPRSDYDQSNSLDYEFFPGHTKRGTGEPLNSFRRLLLRNSGNDSDRWSRSTFFRDAFMQQLIADMGIDYQEYQPVILFLNGEYWGIYNLRERLDHHYLASHYDVEPDEVTILEREGALDHGDPADRLHYLKLIQYLEENDITSSEHYQHIKTQMDIDNFILYQAYQIYVRNTDWPGNNIVFWRYNRDSYDPEAPAGKDGRWRWMVFDTDFGFGLRGGSEAFTHDTLSFATEQGGTEWPNPDWSTFLLRTLLKNETFREEFISRFAGLLNTWFHPDRVTEILDEFQIRYQSSIPENVNRWRVPNSFNQWRNNVEGMREFGEKRPSYVFQHIKDYFNMDGIIEVTLDVNTVQGGTIQIDKEHLHSSHPALSHDIYPWEGKYFQNFPLELQAKPHPGYEFRGWSGSHENASSQLTLTPEEDITLTAHFEWKGFEGDAMNPEAHRLQEKAYQFNYWSPSEPEGSFPPHMAFQQSLVNDPDLKEEMTHPYHIPYTSKEEHEYHEDDIHNIGFPYNLTRRTRINAFRHHGISLINTGRGRDLGAVVLALDTRGVSQAHLSFTVGTVRPNKRIYGLRLQYRIGTDPDGKFQDLLIEGEPVEYIRQSEVHEERFENISLPDKIMGEKYIQLRWKYYHIQGDEGPRAEMRLDNLEVTPLEKTSIEKGNWTQFR